MNASQSIPIVPVNLQNNEISNPQSLNRGKRTRGSSTLTTWNDRVKSSQLSPRLVEAAEVPLWDIGYFKEQADIRPNQTTSALPQETCSSLVRDTRRLLSAGRPSNLRSASGQPPLKKLCNKILSPLPPRHLASLDWCSGNLTLSSPLIVERRAQRQTLSVRVSSSEFADKMSYQTGKEENGGIKTLQTAKGSSKVGGSVLEAAMPSGLGYESTLGNSRSPDDEEKLKGLLLLTEVGVIEILEQDERPTFIIDLGNQANFRPGPLNLVYANASLRTMGGLHDTVVGKVLNDLPGLAAATAFNEFKAWSTSYVRNHEALDVSLPNYFYGGTTWSCSHLRKRLRLVRGNSGFGAAAVEPDPPSVGLPSLSAIKKGFTRTEPPDTRVAQEEPSDYFGRASFFPPVSDLAAATRHGSHSSNAFRDLHAFSNTAGPEDVGLNGQHAFPIRTRSSSGSIPTSPLGENALQADGESHLDHPATITQARKGFFDWTRLPNAPSLPAHVRFAQTVDWASSPLGPMESWTSELRSMCNLIMASPHPAAMYWGEDLTAIYNEAYILLAGQKHPQLMGQRYREAWPEIWDAIKSVFENGRSTGQATMKDDDCLFIKRSSSPALLEETYFSWAVIPIIGADGSVVGFYNPAFEKTRRKIAERRMLTLREIGEKTAAAREVKEFWSQLLKGLEYNEVDTPFALLYSVTEDEGSDTSSMQSDSVYGSKQCILEGSLGFPAGHRVAPTQFGLKDGSDFFANVFREALKSNKPTLLQISEGTLEAGLFEGIEQRGFSDPCQAAVCCPIHFASSDSVLGFLVVGINPRRPYDDDYDLFFQLLSRQLASSMASVVLFEEEIAKGRHAARLAARDQVQLKEQLAARTQEAADSETKFTRMAELAPVGIFISNSQGRITYCNDTWYEISRVPKENNSTDNWMDYVKFEDQEVVKALWSNVVEHGVPMNAEFRFQTPWQDPNGNKGDTWVLGSAYPEKSLDGRIKGIFGSITNISRQKWAEHFEKRRMEEAVETNRQQENFIDITSHEMRNPLSAILQCADEISSTLMEFRSNRNSSPLLVNELMDNSIDAAQTIALCAQHQKRIVDDILTLSKLDSALLLVTPTDVMPISVAQRALKMFDGEVQKADIKLEFKVDESMERMNVGWVKLDPSRLLQVLINLTTNAIKFTTTQEKRIITVTLGASLERPSKEGLNHVSYFPTRAKRKDLTKSTEWGKGAKVFIHFAVQDTGRGLTEDETKLLFLRFSQASPRTHVQYGGSGLGLFISRELVELQGGEIGVSSKAGEGSTFAFYIKARRSTAPPESPNHSPSLSLAKLSTKRPAGPGRLPSASRLQTVKAKKPIPQSSLKILIVEDNLVNQRVLQKQLHNLGCVVYVANHGEECLAQIRESAFWAGRESTGKEITVVLMDLEMPVMDGLTCARRIRELQRNGDIRGHVPIIAVSANARSEQMGTALEAGMVGILLSLFLFLLATS